MPPAARRARTRAVTAADRRPLGLHAFAQALLQAVVLAAVVVTPLYFNPATERVFEPDKLGWVLTLALVALLALITLAGHGPLRWRRPRALSLAVGGALAALALGTLASTVPAVSLWGGYKRPQGLLAYLAFAVLFAAASRAVRQTGAVARLWRAVLLPVAPIGAYALLQRLGVDSVPWDIYGTGVTERAFSSLGNAIFLGAYLVLALPLALAAFVDEWSRQRRRRMALVGYALVLALGVAGLLASQSRGPFLGALVGLLVTGLLYARTSGVSRAGLRAVGWLAAAGLAGLVVAAGAAGFGRLRGLLAAGSRTARQRMLVWETLGDIATADPLRALIGYGPDTLSYVLPPHAPAALVQLVPVQVFDRAHNVLWEWWLSAGLLGVLALLLVYAAAWQCGLRRLGLTPRRGSTAQLTVVAVLGGALVGALVPLALGVSALAALGAVAGVVLGLLVVALLAEAPGAPGPHAALVAGLLGALAGHLVEGALGLPTVSGAVLFWVFLGVLVGLPAVKEPSAAVAPGPAALADGLVDGLVLATIGFAPLLVPWLTLETFRPALLVLIVVGWTVGELLATGDGALAGYRTAGRLGVLGAVAGLLPLVAAAGPPPGTRMLVFALVGLVTVGLLAVALVRAVPLVSPPREPWRLVVDTALVLVTITVAWHVAWRPLVADARLRAGVEAAVAGQADRMQAHFEQAVGLWPEQPYYATYLAAAHRDRALNPDLPADQRSAAFEVAADVLQDAWQRTPDSVFALRLAQLLRDRGDQAGDAAIRSKWWVDARGWSAQALARSPLSPEALVVHATLLERLGEDGAAREHYEQAVALNDAELHARLGLMRLALGDGDVDRAARALDALLARTADDRGPLLEALQASSSAPLDAATVAPSRVMVLAAVGQHEAARTELEQLARARPGDPTLAALRRWLDARRP